MSRPTRSYYQICKVDHQRNQELMVAEVEGLHEAEKLVENFRNNSSEVYTTLDRLEEKGYVSSRIGEATRERMKYVFWHIVRR